MIDQWAGVRERVAALDTQPEGSEVFGSHGHRWALEEPLTEDGLAELEDQIGVRLPEDYRTFLLHVAAGGAGPAYGVFPVRRVQGRWRWEGDGADLADLSMLAEPFPEQGPDPKSLDELLAQRPVEESFDEIEDFDDAIEAWDEQWDALMFAPERTVGAIVISHLGCTSWPGPPDQWFPFSPEWLPIPPENTRHGRVRRHPERPIPGSRSQRSSGSHMTPTKSTRDPSTRPSGFPDPLQKHE